MFSDTVELLTYPTVTDRGRPVPNYDAEPTKVVVDGCDLQPGASTELLAQRSDTTRVSWSLIVPAASLPAGASITEHSIIRVNGSEICQVDGRPLAWLNDGPLSYYSAALSDWNPR